jgi:hypothetical protein
MPGQQANFAIEGDRYEITVQNILMSILSMVNIPRQRDFGIDFYCSVLLRSGNFAQTTRDLFALQVGGRSKPITYGGLRNGIPCQYEIDWLKSLTIPIFHARISADRETVDIFSLLPVWRIFFRSPSPFKIECEFQEPSEDLFTLPDEQPTPSNEEGAFGDGNIWRVNLGPPILSVTKRNLDASEFADRAKMLLRLWLQPSWTTIVRFQTGIALTDFIMSWSTNSLDVLQGQKMYWSPVPGANILELFQALQPALINLGANLQWQDDAAAFTLIPILEWANGAVGLSPFGKGLLEGLRRAQDLGVSPAQVLNRTS